MLGICNSHVLLTLAWQLKGYLTVNQKVLINPSKKQLGSLDEDSDDDFVPFSSTTRNSRQKTRVWNTETHTPEHTSPSLILCHSSQLQARNRQNTQNNLCFLSPLYFLSTSIYQWKNMRLLSNLYKTRMFDSVNTEQPRTHTHLKILKKNYLPCQIQRQRHQQRTNIIERRPICCRAIRRRAPLPQRAD